MGFYLSAGVYSKETDLSNIVASVATTTAALVGPSPKGDTEDIKLMTNTQQFISEYGEPVLGNYFHYTALAFLENGNQLWCQRIHNNARYAGVKIKPAGSAQENTAISTGAGRPDYMEISGEDNLFYIYSKDPGKWGNGLAIRVVDVNSETFEFTINVYLQDRDGNYQLVESWRVSRRYQLDGYGAQQYLESVINGFSRYIVVANGLEVDTILPKTQGTNLPLAKGGDGESVEDSHYISGWEEFKNPDDVDVRILLNGGATSVSVQQKMKEIAESRKDCIAILDIPYEQTSSASATVTWRTTNQNFNSSYTALYSPWVKTYDPYNSVIVTLPPSGFVGSQIAYNDYVAETWYAPAGFNRGLLNVLSVTPVYTQGERDLLYSAGINPLQTFRGEGNVIWGQKTQQAKASATDRLNVRRLLITLEKSIAISLRTFVFEPSSENTRFRIMAIIESYLDQLSAKGAFQTEGGDGGYKVICDETNNTPAVIDRNELHVDVFIKPSRTAEFIRLNTIITSSGASFNELAARGFNL